jgi:hypothetical protein
MLINTNILIFHIYWEKLKDFVLTKIVFPIGHLNVYASNILWPTKLTRIGSKTVRKHEWER